MKTYRKALFVVCVSAIVSLAGCSNKPVASTINEQATLTSPLPYNPLAWRVITSSVNEHKATMSTLYGNDVAVAYARANEGRPYPSGSVIALVTWSQRDDPHWFGARIAANAQAVEFVSFPSAAGVSPAYERYEGAPLARVAANEGDVKRIDYLVSQRAAVTP